ncbi:MAG: hypothetical protein K8T90_05770 [Planctomycetes bacterium]|nr:hypothetical protein [Planctomycetota bacterium]
MTTTTLTAIPQLGEGIYTLGDAARLVGVPGRQVRRWVLGHRYSNDGSPSESGPMWRNHVLPGVDPVTLSFLDLLMVRFVHELEDQEITWPRIRRLIQKAEQRLHTTHPLCSRRFKTDGHALFLETLREDGASDLEDVEHSQLAIRSIMAPFVADLDFGDLEFPLRWWPMGKSRAVVIDPRRSRGQPIAARSGVPTWTLARAVRGEMRNGERSRAQSIEHVAEWYDATPDEVRDACAFEKHAA